MWGVLVDYSWFEEQMWEQRHIFTSLKHSASPRSIVTQDLWSAFIRITSDKTPSVLSLDCIFQEVQALVLKHFLSESIITSFSYSQCSVSDDFAKTNWQLRSQHKWSQTSLHIYYFSLPGWTRRIHLHTFLTSKTVYHLLLHIFVSITSLTIVL